MIDVIARLRADKLATEMSDDRAFTNGSIASHDAEIARYEAMPNDGARLLAYQERCGKLTPEDQKASFEIGMIVKIYDPSSEYISRESPRYFPWITGKIVRKFQPGENGVTIEDRNGNVASAPFGDRIRLVGYPDKDALANAMRPDNVATIRRGLYCGDLFAPTA